jgi:excinuclease ABC subunit C
METLRKTLFHKAKTTSQAPGVYLLKDDSNGVLYIGKEKNLRNRLQTYFQGLKNDHPRTQWLISLVTDFEIILTETEIEALILEATLIKKNKPKFNIRLKDDKAYPYLHLNTDLDFPMVEYTRKTDKAAGRYFGPFPSSWAARQTQLLLTELFQLRDCTDNTFLHRSRPCILHQMHRCSAPCVGFISKEEYHAKITSIIEVLEGKSNKVAVFLKEQIMLAAQQQNFEQACLLRDQLTSLDLVTQTQTVLDPNSNLNKDVIGFAQDKDQACGVILLIRAGKLISVSHLFLDQIEAPKLANEPTASTEGNPFLHEFLRQYYLAHDTTHTDLQAQELLLGEVPLQADLLEIALNKKLTLAQNKHDEQLLHVARTNAEHSLENRLQGTHHGFSGCEAVGKVLKLPKIPIRMECYDISTFHGSDSVGSRVVFIEGTPQKSLYRRYKIKTQTPESNDFLMLQEVFMRRFSHSDEALPDLLIVDGGKGQLSQASRILQELNIQGVSLVGLAKARTESAFQSKDVKTSQERLFIPNRKDPIALKPGSAELRLLTHIRDEAHRFAITYHRHLRNKKVP